MDLLPLEKISNIILTGNYNTQTILWILALDVMEGVSGIIYINTF